MIHHKSNSVGRENSEGDVREFSPELRNGASFSKQRGRVDPLAIIKARIPGAEAALDEAIEKDRAAGRGAAASIDPVRRADAVRPARPVAPIKPLVRVARLGERSLGLATITPEQCEAAYRFYRRRRPLRLRLFGRAATIMTAWRLSSEEAADVDQYAVRVGVDGQQGDLLLPAAVVNFIVGETDPALAIGTIVPEQAALALELVLSESLDALEARAGCRVSLLSIQPAERRAPRDLETALRLAIDVEELGRWDCVLQIGSAQTTLLAQAFDAAAEIEGANVEDLPLPICLRLAASRPTIREIASLAPGDVILFDDACADSAQAIAVVAEHLVAPVALGPAGARLTGGLIRGQGSVWEWSMDKQCDDAKLAEISDAELDDLPVRLVFEIGRIEAPLAEVRRLAAGAVIPLARPVEDAIDIVANGRRLGRGSPIKIGESLGVRVTRMFDRD